MDTINRTPPALDDPVSSLMPHGNMLQYLASVASTLPPPIGIVFRGNGLDCLAPAYDPIIGLTLRNGEDLRAWAFALGCAHPSSETPGEGRLVVTNHLPSLHGWWLSLTAFDQLPVTPTPADVDNDAYPTAENAEAYFGERWTVLAAEQRTKLVELLVVSGWWGDWNAAYAQLHRAAPRDIDPAPARPANALGGIADETDDRSDTPLDTDVVDQGVVVVNPARIGELEAEHAAQLARNGQCQASWYLARCASPAIDGDRYCETHTSHGLVLA